MQEASIRNPYVDLASSTHAPRPNWRDNASCLGMDPEIFFPDEDKSAPAKAVCAACPVSSQCLDWAITSGQRYGVLGGMTAEERRSLKRTPQRNKSKK